MPGQISFLLVAVIVSFTLGMDANAPLELLDRRIFDEISEPTETIGRGDLVLKEMIAYYLNLYELFNSLKFKEEKGIEIIGILEKDGGPRVPNMAVNGEALKAAYKWGDRDVEILTTMLGSINGLWRKVTDKVYQFSSSVISHRL